MTRAHLRDTARKHRHLSGVLLCLLVVVFALAAKASWYRAHPEAGKAIVSMKVAKADALPVEAAIPIATIVPLLFAMAAVMLLASLSFSFASPQLARPQTAFVRRPVVRPPPAL